MARTYTRRELRLLGEYLAATYPHATIANNVRLGDYPIHLARQLPPDVPKESLSSYRRYVDAIVKLPDKVILVEAKIILDTDAYGAMKLYATEWPNTPEYQSWTALPFDQVLVAAVIDPKVKAMAEADGMIVVQYSPPWLSSADLKSQANVGVQG